MFAYQSKVRAVFRDVLALHEINHIAIAYINPQHELITLSSTPSLEYNLFSTPLWQWDNTYSPDWFKQCGQSSWQALYSLDRYDELYYIKQAKPRYPLGISIAETLNQGHMIYSFASAMDSEYTRNIFVTQQNELRQIGRYCTTHLLPFLLESNDAIPSFLQPDHIGT